MQIPGVYYTEPFSPVASDTAIRVTNGVVLYYQKHCPIEKRKLELFGLEAAFLNADIDMKCFLEWPDGMQEFRFFYWIWQATIVYWVKERNVWKHWFTILMDEKFYRIFEIWEITIEAKLVTRKET
jgi:hypothetical protein